jgi:hypothetical protein
LLEIELQKNGFCLFHQGYRLGIGYLEEHDIFVSVIVVLRDMNINCIPNKIWKLWKKTHFY